MEKRRWPESPCYCEAVCNDGWKVCDDWSIYNSTPKYDEYRTYRAGDICVLDGRLWEATKRVTGVFPYVRNSDIDTLERMVGWISERLKVLDEYYGYEPGQMAVQRPAPDTALGKEEEIYAIDGKRIPQRRKGINIVRYGNGASRVIYQK